MKKIKAISTRTDEQKKKVQKLDEECKAAQQSQMSIKTTESRTRKEKNSSVLSMVTKNEPPFISSTAQR